MGSQLYFARNPHFCVPTIKVRPPDGIHRDQPLTVMLILLFASSLLRKYEACAGSFEQQKVTED